MADDTRTPTSADAVRAMVAARLRSQLQYRSSFAADVLGQVLLIPLEFIEVYALLLAAPVFGGMNLTQASVVYGLSVTGFGIADMLVGQLDNVNRSIKNGTLEVLLTRPMSLLVQLVTQDIQLRRLGRAVVGLAIYLVALAMVPATWSAWRVALAVLAPVGAALVYGALFLFAAATLFFILDGNQFVNAFTYGSRYAGSLPGAALMTPVRILFTFVVPATLIAYVPAAVLTDAVLPSFWWPGLAWLTIPLGLAMWAVVLLWWRVAIRHYTGAGG